MLSLRIPAVALSGWLLLALAVPWPALAQAQEAESASKPPARVEVAIDGLTDAMLDSAQKAVELRALATRRNASDALIQRLHERAPAQISKALEAFGYYQVQVSSELERVGATYQARYLVTLGQPTRVHELHIDTGVEAESRRVQRVVRAFRPRREEVLHHPTYEASKARLFQALLAEGYLEAQLERARVEVMRANSSADIELVFRPGQRYDFGGLNFVNSQVDTASLARLAPFAEGEQYRQAQLLTLQRRLVDTGYFSVVDVAPDVDALADGRVPIEVRLEPTARTEYRGGLYFGTDSGAGVRGSVERRWMNHRGDQGRAELEYSQRTKLAALVYTIPLDRPGRPRLQFRTSWSDRITDSSESRQARLSAAYIGSWRDWNQSLSINLVDGDFEVGEEPGSSTLLYPEWHLTRSSLRPAGDPARGQSLSLSVRAGAEALLSDTDFVQLLAQIRHVRPIGKQGDRLIFRGDLGATYVDDFDKLPPELRFFSGGDRSLRGFGYQELGPVNERGEVRGGPYLALASAEYERRINSTWAVAGFVDVGNAFDSGQFDAVVSVGTGVRWRGPVGLVRLDLGVGVSEDDVPIRLHLIIGGDL